MNTKLSFLQSRRFWGLIIIAVIGVLESQGIIPADMAGGLVIIIGGFIGIRTVDRFGENRQ